MHHPPLTAVCPADPLLRALWGQWKTHILYLLGESGPTRFGEIQRRLEGISPKVLTSRLRDLAVDRLIWREQTATVPPQVTYGLTPIGQEIHRTLKSFDALARLWADQD